MYKSAEQRCPARANWVQPRSMSNWLTGVGRPLAGKPKWRLVCFPYAGGGPGVFRGWSELLPQDVEILCAHLPGRESRIADFPETDFNLVVSELVGALSELLPAPTLFFGHSLGGLLAYEVAFRLTRTQSVNAPVRMVLSGCCPPGVEKHLDAIPAWLLPEQQFIDKLRELNGTPEEVLASKELLSLYLPILRADFQLASNARQALRPGLGLHTHVLGGVEDVEATEEDLQQWRAYLSTTPQVTMFPGGHFFLRENSHAVCAVVAKQLGEVGLK